MQDTSDLELLQQYHRQGTEAAFATLVARHVNLVYSVALRQVGNAVPAEEITQAVFILLARKADKLSPPTVLAGWLHETTRLTALAFLRGERRRQAREQEAYMQSTLTESAEPAAWPQLAPLLDEALARLGKKDRDAVLLRFFQEQNLAAVAAALQVSEPAAQRRVHRAVEKLRKFFAKRGVALSGVALAGAISANSVQAAPVGLAKTISVVAITKGAAASASTLTLIKGALKIMAWTKMKTTVVVGVAVLLTAGTATVAVKTIHALRPQPDIQGAWEGIVQATQGAKLRLVLKVTKANNVYRATMDSVDQRASDIPVSKLDYDSPTLNFQMSAVKGSFTGKLNPAATEISGTWKQPYYGLVAPLVLKRTPTPSTIPDLLTERDYTPRAGSDLQGYWKGATQIGTGLLPVVFKFSEPEDGKFVAELDSPDQGANNLVVSAVTYDKPAVHVEIGAVGGVFEGDLGNGGNEIKGIWSQAGVTLPLTIKRTDPRADHAQVSALEAKKDYSYTSPNDLTGHWKGALDVNRMTLHLALHVAKLPDGKLAGLLDSLDQGANGIPANAVRFIAPDAHLEWQTIAGVFDAKLEKGKLAGTWRQGGQSFPLVFERTTAD